MRIRLLALLALVALALPGSGSLSATTLGLSSAVTGASNPATTALAFSVPANSLFEVMGVIPVVSTVSGAPASMAASVNVGTSSNFTYCSEGLSAICSSDLWAAQWTIVSAPTGIQAVNAFQGSTVKLVNNSVQPGAITLRCQVGQMTGSCIFVSRVQPISDPLF
ncbi:MAG: hypothetical protein ABJC61_15315 [Acidobacteriota bacterium]